MLVYEHSDYEPDNQSQLITIMRDKHHFAGFSRADNPNRFSHFNLIIYLLNKNCFISLLRNVQKIYNGNLQMAVIINSQILR